MVAFDRAIADPRTDVVLTDNVAGARRGAAHLIEECGHRRVGFIGGPTTVQTGVERQRGYEEAMSAAGLRALVAHGGFRLEGGRQAADELIDEGATALLVANNLMAVGVLQAVKARGLRPRTDIGLVSIDDPPWASLTDPPLTTLAQPVRAMADAAVELLFHRLEHGRTRRKRVVFDFELRHRDSCCPHEPD